MLNKVDLCDKASLLPRLAEYEREVGFADLVPVSAKTGENVDRLESVLLSHLPEGEPLYPEDYLTDQPERFFVAELIREQVLQQTHDELPFSTAVVVDKFEEPDAKGLMRLFCTILVDRESQKPILVGKGGVAHQGDRHGGAQGAASSSSTRASFSICTSRCARAGARTSACSTRSACRRAGNDRNGLYCGEICVPSV